MTNKEIIRHLILIGVKTGDLRLTDGRSLRIDGLGKIRFCEELDFAPNDINTDENTEPLSLPPSPYTYDEIKGMGTVEEQVEALSKVVDVCNVRTRPDLAQVLGVSKDDIKNFMKCRIRNAEIGLRDRTGRPPDTDRRFVTQEESSPRFGNTSIPSFIDKRARKEEPEEPEKTEVRNNIIRFKNGPRVIPRQDLKFVPSQPLRPESDFDEIAKDIDKVMRAAANDFSVSDGRGKLNLDDILGADEMTETHPVYSPLVAYDRNNPDHVSGVDLRVICSFSSGGFSIFSTRLKLHVIKRIKHGGKIYSLKECYYRRRDEEATLRRKEHRFKDIANRLRNECRARGIQVD